MPYGRAFREKLAERQRIRREVKRAHKRNCPVKAAARKLELDEMKKRASQLIREAFALEVPTSINPEKEI